MQPDADVPDSRRAEKGLLERARDLARKSKEKLRELLGDDTKEKSALPTDPTDEVPPVT